MNSFLNPHNGTSLTGVIDLTVHSISLFQENEEPQNIKDTFIHNDNISIAEPYDVQIDETGNNFITMYQFNGDINDTKVAGLESLLNYMNGNFFSTHPTWCQTAAALQSLLLQSQAAKGGLFFGSRSFLS